MRNRIILLLWIAVGCTQCYSPQEPATQASPPTADTTYHLPGVDQGLYVENIDPNDWQADWSTENTVIARMKSEPNNLHPTNSPSNLTKVLGNFIHQYIVQYDPRTMELVPGVVTALPTVDGNRFTYTLRKDITWDDGSPLTVQDIGFTLKAVRCALTQNGQSKSMLESVADLEIDASAGSFTLVMARPYIQNISFLTDHPVLQQSHYDPDNVMQAVTWQELAASDFDEAQYPKLVDWANRFNSADYGHVAENIQGLGPYRLAAWEPGQRIVLERKADHWSYKLSTINYLLNAAPDRIIYKLVSDAAALNLELKNQTIDYVENMSTESLIELQKDPDFNRNYFSRFMGTYRYSYLAFNLRPDVAGRSPFFNDVRVREALALLTPVDQLIQLLNQGKAGRQAGPGFSLKPDYNHNLNPVPYDPAAAAKLLEEAGWSDSDQDGIRDKMIDGKKVSFEFELLHPENQSWTNYAQFLEREYQQAGIVVNAKPLSVQRILEKTEARDFDGLLLTWSSDPSPDDHSQIWSTQSWGNGGFNFGGFGNAQTDQLIDSINQTVDPAVRLPLSHRFQQIVQEEHPYIFLICNAQKLVLHKRFREGHMHYLAPYVQLNNLQLRAPQEVSPKD